MKINNQIFLIIDNLRNNFKIYITSQLFLIICFGVFSVMPFQINNEKIFFNILPLNKEDISLEDYNYMLLLSQKPLSIIAPSNSTDLEKKFKEQVNKELFNYKKSKIKKKTTTRKNLLMHEINLEAVSNSLKEL